MKTKSLVVAAAIALIAIGAAAGSRDVTWLGRKANLRVHSHAEFRHAILVIAFGTTGTHHAGTTARDITRWAFTYDNTASRDQYKTALIVAVRGKFGTAKGNKSTISGTAPIRRIAMTLPHAIKLLRAAGYTQGFFNVSLGKLPGPHKHTKYDFRLVGEQYVTVDTVTGKVKALN